VISLMHVAGKAFITQPLFAALLFAIFEAMRNNAYFRVKDAFRCPQYLRVVRLALVWALVSFALMMVPWVGILVIPLFILWSLALPLFVDNQHIPLKVRLAYRLSTRFVFRKLCLVLGTMLFIGLINFIGVLLFVVPVLFTLPYSIVLYVYLYQALVGVNGVAVLVPELQAQEQQQQQPPASVAVVVAAAPVAPVMVAPQGSFLGVQEPSIQ